MLSSRVLKVKEDINKTSPSVNSQCVESQSLSLQRRSLNLIGLVFVGILTTLSGGSKVSAKEEPPAKAGPVVPSTKLGSRPSHYQMGLEILLERPAFRKIAEELYEKSIQLEKSHPYSSPFTNIGKIVEQMHAPHRELSRSPNFFETHENNRRTYLNLETEWHKSEKHYDPATLEIISTFIPIGKGSIPLGSFVAAGIMSDTGNTAEVRMKALEKLGTKYTPKELAEAFSKGVKDKAWLAKLVKESGFHSFLTISPDTSPKDIEIRIPRVKDRRLIHDLVENQTKQKKKYEKEIADLKLQLAEGDLKVLARIEKLEEKLNKESKALSEDLVGKFKEAFSKLSKGVQDRRNKKGMTRAEYKQALKDMATYQSATSAITDILSVINPKASKAFASFAKIGMAIAFGAITPSPQVFSNVVSGITGLISLIGNKKSIDQITLEEIYKTQEAIEELRKQMHERFDRVDKMLRLIYRQGRASLADQQAILRDLEYIRYQNRQIFTVLDENRKVTEKGFNDSWEIDRDNALEGVDSFLDDIDNFVLNFKSGKPESNKEKALEFLANSVKLCNHAPSRISVSGSALFSQADNPGYFSRLVEYRGIRAMLNPLNNYLSSVLINNIGGVQGQSRKSITKTHNPEIYATIVLGILIAQENWLKGTPRLTKDQADKMIGIGNSILDFEASLVKGAAIPAAIRHYLVSLDSAIEAYASMLNKHNFKRDNRASILIDLTQGLEQFTPTMLRTDDEGDILSKTSRELQMHYGHKITEGRNFFTHGYRFLQFRGINPLNQLRIVDTQSRFAVLKYFLDQFVYDDVKAKFSDKEFDAVFEKPTLDGKMRIREQVFGIHRDHIITVSRAGKLPESDVKDQQRNPKDGQHEYSTLEDAFFIDAASKYIILDSKRKTVNWKDLREMPKANRFPSGPVELTKRSTTFQKERLHIVPKISLRRIREYKPGSNLESKGNCSVWVNFIPSKGPVAAHQWKYIKGHRWNDTMTHTTTYDEGFKESLKGGGHIYNYAQYRIIDKDYKDQVVKLWNNQWRAQAEIASSWSQLVIKAVNMHLRENAGLNMPLAKETWDKSEDEERDNFDGISEKEWTVFVKEFAPDDIVKIDLSVKEGSCTRFDILLRGGVRISPSKAIIRNAVQTYNSNAVKNKKPVIQDGSILKGGISLALKEDKATFHMSVKQDSDGLVEYTRNKDGKKEVVKTGPTVRETEYADLQQATARSVLEMGTIVSSTLAKALRSLDDSSTLLRALYSQGMPNQLLSSLEIFEAIIGDRGIMDGVTIEKLLLESGGERIHPHVVYKKLLERKKEIVKKLEEAKKATEIILKDESAVLGQTLIHQVLAKLREYKESLED